MDESCNDIESINPVSKTVESLENSTDPERSTSLSNTSKTLLECRSSPSSILTNSSVEGDTPSSKFDSNSYNNDLQTDLLTNREAAAAIQEIVCYGLGNFWSSVTARYQLALLLLLIEKLQVNTTTVKVLFTNNYNITSIYVTSIPPIQENGKINLHFSSWTIHTVYQKMFYL